MAIKRIDHIAIVVDNVEGALEFWEDALGLQMDHMEEVHDQESIVAFLPSGHSEVELVEPTSDTSGVAKYLAKRGPGMHHICFEVDNIEQTLARMKAKGVKLINETPTIGTGGKKIAFIHPSSTHGVLVELYELTPEEPMRRRRLIREWRSRISTQRAVASAGLRTFVKSWRQQIRRNNAQEREEIVLKQE
jgi:methylmalonyl-CoA/ethylmalonyl-CoA epimerase